MKRILAIVMAVSLLFGCSAPAKPTPQEPQSKEYTFTDDLERQVTVNNPQKVAVAMGSFAELWQQAGGTLYATTEDSFNERELKDVDKIVNMGSLSAPNVETMVAEGVDFLILSAKRKEHVAMGETLDKMGINYAYFDVNYFDEYLHMLDICTDITGRKDLYQTNGLDVQAKIEKTIADSKIKENPPTVLLIRAFSTGANAQGSKNMTGKMLNDLGCINIADSDSGLLDNLSMEQVIDKDPDYIFLITMGASTEKAMETMKEKFTDNPAWSSLSAVKSDKYIVLPKELFHYKPNAKWGESYEMLAQMLTQK
ncbi:MAG: ABC transporter substrate-binding protein [Oscillospiraceae bacterium]